MRPIAVLTIAFVFASATLFVSTASAQSPSLSGQVCVGTPYSYDDGSSDPASPCAYGQGLPGATVTLTRAGPMGLPVGGTTATATSDANGHYSFSNLASGSYAYRITRTGFQEQSGTVDVGQAKALDARMKGNAVDARGIVRDVDGAAIPKATLGFCCGDNGAPSATTGSDGRFSTSLTAGYWQISVSAPGFQAQHTSLLVDGGDLAFKLERVPPQDGRITGRVVDQDGNPVPEARVTVSNHGYWCCGTYAEDSPSSTSASKPASAPDRSMPYYGENHTFADADGRFAIGAYSGYNSVSVSKDGHAHQSRGIEVAAGSPTTLDVELMKFPEKTAKLTGKLLDANGKPVRNAYINVQWPAYGLHECSQADGSGDGSSGSSAGSAGAPEPASGSSVAREPAYSDPGCGITLRPDGSFEGLVTPGYAVVGVYVDHWSSCVESSSSDGSFKRECGPEYYSWTRSLTLAPDETTKLDIRLRERPTPDAEVSGYIVDAESGQAIPGASISFSNQDTYGWGRATADKDGSYRIALRPGYHTVSVWAEGHLRWEGVLDVAKGDTPFDVEVVPGQESHGGYGPYYARDGVASMEASDGKAGAPSMSGSNGLSSDSDDAQQGMQYEDLGGGLGPYDARARQAELESGSEGSPGFGLLALLAALGAVLVLRRR